VTSDQARRTADAADAKEDHVDVKDGATRMDEVSMSAGVHGILRDMTLRIQREEHVAIISLSDAGKSSLEALREAAQERPHGRAFQTRSPWPSQPCHKLRHARS